jgi:hypothetical protein
LTRVKLCKARVDFIYRIYKPANVLKNKIK